VELSKKCYIFEYKTLNLLCERKRALYGIKCVLRIF
jgi:hypothetical protein